MVRTCTLMRHYMWSAQRVADSMNKRLISRLMREQVDGLRNSGIYFFRGDFDYILQGAALEYVPRGLYIWSFSFPLFDFFGPNLSFSNRLTEKPFIAKGEMNEREIVDFVLSAAEVRAQFQRDFTVTLDEFVRFVEAGHARSPHARLMQAAALILLGQGETAAPLLQELPPRLHPYDVPHCNQLVEALKSGEGIAIGLLQQIRHKNLVALGAA